MFYRTIGLVPWTAAAGAATSDHSGLTIDQGLSEYGGGLSISATRGLSGYRNFFVSLREFYEKLLQIWRVECDMRRLRIQV